MWICVRPSTWCASPTALKATTAGTTALCPPCAASSLSLVKSPPLPSFCCNPRLYLSNYLPTCWLIFVDRYIHHTQAVFTCTNPSPLCGRRFNCAADPLTSWRSWNPQCRPSAWQPETTINKPFFFLLFYYLWLILYYIVIRCSFL